WGTNDLGQLGDVTLGDSATPVAPACTQCGGGVLEVVSGAAFSCALLATHGIVCWGQAAFGNGTNPTSPLMPTNGPPTSDWETIAAGDLQTCGIKLDDTLWCWGHGEAGQLGNGVLGNTVVPMQVGPPYSWQSVAPGRHTTCGIASDGSRWCWGYYASGEYGD